MEETPVPPLPHKAAPGLTRPWCCPDKKCVPLHLVGEPDEANPGKSFLCFGKMERPTTFVYDGVGHTNNVCTCTYTPLKGLIRFQENADDWFLMAHAYATGLWHLAGKPAELRPQRPWVLRKAVLAENEIPCHPDKEQS